MMARFSALVDAEENREFIARKRERQQRLDELSKSDQVLRNSPSRRPHESLPYRPRSRSRFPSRSRSKGRNSSRERRRHHRRDRSRSSSRQRRRQTRLSRSRSRVRRHSRRKHRLAARSWSRGREVDADNDRRSRSRSRRERPSRHCSSLSRSPDRSCSPRRDRRPSGFGLSTFTSRSGDLSRVPERTRPSADQVERPNTAVLGTLLRDTLISNRRLDMEQLQQAREKLQQIDPEAASQPEQVKLMSEWLNSESARTSHMTQSLRDEDDEADEAPVFESYEQFKARKLSELHRRRQNPASFIPMEW